MFHHACDLMSQNKNHIYSKKTHIWRLKEKSVCKVRPQRAGLLLKSNYLRWKLTNILPCHHSWGGRQGLVWSNNSSPVFTIPPPHNNWIGWCMYFPNLVNNSNETTPVNNRTKHKYVFAYTYLIIYFLLCLLITFHVLLKKITFHVLELQVFFIFFNSYT